MSDAEACPDCGREMFVQERCCSGCGCYPELWCPRCRLTREKDLSITRPSPLHDAAPELLESCKELLADSHGHTGDCAVWIQDEDGAVISYQAEECDCEFGAKRARACAAIAKAGRS